PRVAPGVAQGLAHGRLLAGGGRCVGAVLDAGDDDLDVLDRVALRARAHGLAGALHRGVQDRLRGLWHLGGARDGGRPDEVHAQRVAGGARARGDAHARLAEQGLVLDGALEARLALGRLGQRLAVHDLRATDVGVDAV